METGLVLDALEMMTITTWTWRHSTRLRDATDRQAYGGDRPG
ncbi:hypothetical protein [Streptomyces yatensis]|nr:hypothetical protein [Streptomyces yatensis]